jgi:16S rRNA G966 N2-methylase RsmD
MDGREMSGVQNVFGDTHLQWTWVREQLPYTTPNYISEKIAELIWKIYGTQENSLIIWDMFSGLGVDLINIANIGENVTVFGTEISPEIFNLLERNVITFNKYNNMHVYNTDCTGVLNLLKYCNVIYFDPPWSKMYVSSKIFDFTKVTLPNGKSVIELLLEIYRVQRNIVIKSPLKCKTFERLGLDIYRIFVFRKHNLKFIMLK